jgi:hypothetical protein
VLAAQSAAQNQYNQATAAMILILGIGVAADVMTMGAAIGLTGTNLMAVWAWEAAGESLDAANEAVAEASAC